MKTNLALKFALCMVVAFVTFRFMSNGVRSQDDPLTSNDDVMTFYSGKPQSREFKYQRIWKRVRTDQQLKALGSENTNNKNNHENNDNNANPNIGDVGNLKGNTPNSYPAADQVLSFAVKNSVDKQVIKQLWKKENDGGSDEDRDIKNSAQNANLNIGDVDNLKGNTPKPLLIDLNNQNQNASPDEEKSHTIQHRPDSYPSADQVLSFSVKNSVDKKVIKQLWKKENDGGSDEDRDIKNSAQNDNNNNNKIQNIKSLSQRFLSSGFGLKTTKTNSGETVLMENGVIYQPIKQDPLKMFEKNPNPRLTNYDPFIPFDKSVFFRGSSNTPPIRVLPYTAKEEDRPNTQKEKIILWYTPARYTPPSSYPKPLRFCPDFPCKMTTNQKYFNQSDLVVFNGQRLGPKPPSRVSPRQRFLFHNQEPPITVFFKNNKNFRNAHWRSVFNWTMSYRTDSTIPSYYGIVRKRPNPPEKDYNAIVAEKNGTVAWMVSHCGSPSKRDKYVEILKKYIDVDIYGGCGTFKCPRKNDEQCNRDIAKRYKFYLGFENAFCPDYVSEKFFRFMSSDIITVSRTMKDTLDFRAAPGTYIDTHDYPSPKHLAEYLTYLDKNDDAYIQMLREKDQYIYLFEEYTIRRQEDNTVKFIHYHYEAVPFCQVCQKLWAMKEGSEDRIGDIAEWFDRKLCFEPDDLDMV